MWKVQPAQTTAVAKHKNFMPEKNILFLCTGNSCRSQMAEALAREILPKHIQCWSAGIAAHGMNPHVATVMQEIGLNIDSQYSKIIEDLPDIKFDYVITVCNNASEQCPTFPATKILHHSFSDPPKLALAYNTEEEKIDCYRKVRDEIQSWLSLQDLNC